MCIYLFPLAEEVRKNFWHLRGMSDHQSQVMSTLTMAGDMDPWKDKPPDARPNSHIRPSHQQSEHHPQHSSPASTGAPSMVLPAGSAFQTRALDRDPGGWVRTGSPVLLSFMLLCLFCPPPFKMWQQNSISCVKTLPFLSMSYSM